MIPWSREACDYGSHAREYRVAMPGKAILLGPADAAFKGDPTLHNPEDCFSFSVTACHTLTYLAGCARSGVVVEGIMAIKDRRMRFTEVVSPPNGTMSAGADLARVRGTHEAARDECFIDNSVRFPMRHEATIMR
jgi:organic hydroperoxide reductase OsmC/OhrA